MTELDRTKVTFEQAEGLEPLPTQLNPMELSQGLRAGLWYVVHQHLAGVTKTSPMGDSPPWIGDPWRGILFEMHVSRDHLPADEFRSNAKENTERLKAILMHGTYSQVFGTLQWILRRRACPHNFLQQIASALRSCHAGYRLTEDGRTFIPITSEEDARVAARAFAAVGSSDTYSGARGHLTTAAESLTAGDWPGGVRESIHAVESVVRVLTGKQRFSDAVAVLEKRWSIHRSLKAAFGNLYGYTSDEPGIRHPLLDDPKAAVDEADALFMFGACSSFVSYLISKERQSGANRA